MKALDMQAPKSSSLRHQRNLRSNKAPLSAKTTLKSDLSHSINMQLQLYIIMQPYNESQASTMFMPLRDQSMSPLEINSKQEILKLK